MTTPPTLHHGTLVRRSSSLVSRSSPRRQSRGRQSFAGGFDFLFGANPLRSE